MRLLTRTAIEGRFTWTIQSITALLDTGPNKHKDMLRRVFVSMRDPFRPHRFFIYSCANAAPTPKSTAAPTAPVFTGSTATAKPEEEVDDGCVVPLPLPPLPLLIEVVEPAPAPVEVADDEELDEPPEVEFSAAIAVMFSTLGYVYDPFVIAGDGTYHRTVHRVSQILVRLYFCPPTDPSEGSRRR